LLRRKPNAAAVGELFQREHEKVYGFREPETPIEITTVRLRVTGKIPPIRLPTVPSGEAAPAREPPGLPPRSTSRGAGLRPQRPRIRRPHSRAGHRRAGDGDGLVSDRLGRIRRPDRKFGARPGRRGQAIKAEPAKHDKEGGRPLEALPMSQGQPPHPWWGEGVRSRDRPSALSSCFSSP